MPPTTAERAALLMRHAGRAILPLDALAGALRIPARAVEDALREDPRFLLLHAPPLLEPGDDWAPAPGLAYAAAFQRAGLAGGCTVVLIDPAGGGPDRSPVARATAASPVADLVRTVAALIRHHGPSAADTLGAAAALESALSRLGPPPAVPEAPSTTPRPPARR